MINTTLVQLLLVATIVVAQRTFFNSDDPTAGGIQFIIDLQVKKQAQNCQYDGSFEKHHFFWTKMGKSSAFDEDLAAHLPGYTYELQTDDATDYLIHKFNSNGLHLPAQTCTVSSDWQMCSFVWQGQESSASYPNCYISVQVLARRLKYRFCPAGFYFKGELARMCEHCPSSTYSDAMNTDTQCKSCPYYTDGTMCKPACPPGQESVSGVCKNCQIGTYNPDADSKCRNCSDIDSHSYQDREGQTSCKRCNLEKTDGSKCFSCGAGQYWTKEQCNSCPAGTYNDETQHQRTQCKPCTGKSYSDVTGATSCKNCAHDTTLGNTKCLRCGTGTEWVSSDACQLCAPGTFNDVEGDAAKCKKCQGSSYSDKPGSTMCKPCAHETDGTSCRTCPAGTHWSTNNECVPCSPGQYKKEESDSPQCNLCPPGEYVTRSGATQCDRCEWPTDKTRTICAPPCPESASRTRGQFGKKQQCICPPFPQQQPVTTVKYFTDDSSLCTAAVNEKIIDSQGGAITYINSKLDVTSDKTDTIYTFAFDKSNDYTLVAANQVQERLYQQALEEYIISRPIQEDDEYSARHMVIANLVNKDSDLPYKAKPYPKFYRKKFGSLRKQFFGQTSFNATDLHEEQPVMAAAPYNGPDSYDFRTAHPECKFHIYDQGACGACVSVATASILGDRLCIATQGRVNEPLSPQYLLDCVHKDCEGWVMINAFAALEKYGVPSESCYPYKSGDRSKIYSCRSTCVDGSPMTKRYARVKSYHKLPTTDNIKLSLVERGPVTAAFTVFEDLLVYSSGIYIHKYGQKIEEHAVRVIGFGNENGMDYWLMANSWGTDFGENGVFKVAAKIANINLITFEAIHPALE